MLSSASTIWVLVAAALVFFMQAGFAMVETGLTRAKNAGNIIMKNMMDFSIGTILYWFFGFGIMFAGSSAFIGGLDFLSRGGLYGYFTGRRTEIRIPHFSNGVLCYGGYDCVGCHGRKNQFLSLLHI